MDQEKRSICSTTWTFTFDSRVQSTWKYQMFSEDVIRWGKNEKYIWVGNLNQRNSDCQARWWQTSYFDAYFNEKDVLQTACPLLSSDNSAAVCLLEMEKKKKKPWSAVSVEKVPSMLQSQVNGRKKGQFQRSRPKWCLLMVQKSVAGSQPAEGLNISESVSISYISLCLNARTGQAFFTFYPLKVKMAASSPNIRFFLDHLPRQVVS